MPLLSAMSQSQVGIVAHPDPGGASPYQALYSAVDPKQSTYLGF